MSKTTAIWERVAQPFGATCDPWLHEISTLQQLVARKKHKVSIISIQWFIINK